MQYPQLFPYVDEDVTFDDIDKLFGQLQAVEPPPAFILHMLNQVPSKTSYTPIFAQPMLQDKLDRWLVQAQRNKLC